jgi:hypothetical protein
VTTLERHCRLLLRFYPAAYREVRGEEMIGTLLEATSPGRSWPLPRDIRGLIFGGLRARAVLNQQFTVAANLRVPVLAGVVGYVAYSAVGLVSLDVLAETSAHGHFHGALFGWPILLASSLMLLAVGLALLTSRRAVVLAAALPAAAVVWDVSPWSPGNAATAMHVALLAAVVALAGGSKRPRPHWLVLVGLLAVVPLVPFIGPQSGPVLYGALLFMIAAISIAWAVIDARPAIAISAFFLALWLPAAVTNLMLGFTSAIAVPDLVTATAVGVAALWLLRRQSAHPGRPTRTP